MRLPVLALVATLLASATPALAAPASVDVSVDPRLQDKFEKVYGVREAELLTHDLKVSVERGLAKTAAFDGARVELVLTDVRPNRPTFKQLGDVTGLSFHSFGTGGAAIEGQVTAADGTRTPVAYKWYETDITQSYGAWVWSDAVWTFDRFARRLARGEELAKR